MNRVQGPIPSLRPLGEATPHLSHPADWAGRSLDKPPPEGHLVWSDEEDDDPASENGLNGVPDDDGADVCPLHKLSAATEATLAEAFAKPVANNTRRRWQKMFGMPATDITKCPKLDNTL